MGRTKPTSFRGSGFSGFGFVAYEMEARPWDAQQLPIHALVFRLLSPSISARQVEKALVWPALRETAGRPSDWCHPLLQLECSQQQGRPSEGQASNQPDLSCSAPEVL